MQQELAFDRQLRMQRAASRFEELRAEWSAEESQRLARARAKLAELDHRLGRGDRQHGTSASAVGHRRWLFPEEEWPEQDQDQAIPPTAQEKLEITARCFVELQTGAGCVENIREEVLQCSSAGDILEVCDAKLSQFTVSATVSALAQIAQKPDNFKVRRDPSFSLLLARASQALSQHTVSL